MGYKVELISDEHSSRVIPQNQPVVADSKLRIGNGRDVFDDLPVVSTITSGEVVRKRLGPYRVTFESLDLATNTGEELSLPLPEGTIIEMAWLESVIDWASETSLPDDAFLTIMAASTINPEECNGLVYYPVGTGAFQSNTEAFPVAAFQIHRDLDATIPCRLKQEATINVSGETSTVWTAGESDLYLLISEPV